MNYKKNQGSCVRKAFYWYITKIGTKLLSSFESYKNETTEGATVTRNRSIWKSKYNRND